MSLEGQGRARDCGFAMAGLLVSMTIMAVALSVALPVWKTVVQREREEELIFRGRQYARAIQLYQRKFANAYPSNFDVLTSGRFLRKKYKDPITGEDFQPLYGASGTRGPQQQPQPKPASKPPAGGPGGQPPSQGAAGVVGGLIGVVSKSTATSIREYNGKTKYNEWAFVAQVVTQQPSAPNQPAAKPGPNQPPAKPSPTIASPPSRPRL